MANEEKCSSYLQPNVYVRKQNGRFAKIHNYSITLILYDLFDLALMNKPIITAKLGFIVQLHLW